MKDPGERKQSPLPWHTGANNPDRVFDAKGAPVAHCDPRHKGFPIYENNARLIVEATTVYGAHAALSRAPDWEAVEEALEGAANALVDASNTLTLRGAPDEAARLIPPITRIDAALAVLESTNAEANALPVPEAMRAALEYIAKEASECGDGAEDATPAARAMLELAAVAERALGRRS